MGKYHIEGLREKEVQQSRKEHGSNELELPETESFWDKLKENFEVRLIARSYNTLTGCFIGPLNQDSLCSTCYYVNTIFFWLRRMV